MKLKTALAGTLGALLAISLAGCGTGGGSSTTAPTSAPPASTSAAPAPAPSTTVNQSASSGATELTFWTFIALHGKFYETMAGKWNAAHPDKQVHLNVNVMPYDDMHNQLQLALNSGQGAPDIVDIEVSKFPNFTTGTPALMDLTQVAAPYAADIVQARMQLYQKDGKQYGLPTHVGTTLAFYNTDLMDKAGVDYTKIKTWDDFTAAGVAYTKATGKAFATADTSASWVIDTVMGQLGTDYLDASGKVQVNNPDMVKTLTLLKGIQTAGAAKTIAGGQPDTEEAFGLLNSGEYAAVIMPEWFMSRYTAYMPDLKGKVTIAPPPVMDGAKVKTVGGGGTGTAIPSQGKNTALASEFLAYAKLSKDGAIEIWNSLGFDPCNMALWTDATITKNPDNQFNQYFKNNVFDVLNQVKDGIGYLPSATYQAKPNINNMMTTTVLNEIFENGADIQKTLDTAQADLKNELGQ